jgi:hypothetical protein
MALLGTRLKSGGVSEHDWLGAEALPSGLVTFEDSARWVADALKRDPRSMIHHSVPSGLVAAGARWINKALRRS